MIAKIIIFLLIFRYSFSTTSVGIIKNAQFNPDESLFRLSNISSINSQSSCTCQCWMNSMCVTATYQAMNKTCSLFFAQLWQGELKSVAINTNTTTITFQNKNVAVYGVNILMNGDGESGPCESSYHITPPTGWTYDGAITQMLYNDTTYGTQLVSTPGPSDRGKCYFVGNNDANPSMFQIWNLNAYANDIDNGRVSFNLSAWLGGYTGQNDAAKVSIYFQNSVSQNIGNRTSIGPVLDTDRAGITATVFRQAIGFIPVNSRTIIISVNMTMGHGPWNDASVDNIRVEFKYI